MKLEEAASAAAAHHALDDAVPMYDADTVEVPAMETHTVIPSGVFTIRGPVGHRTVKIERQDENAKFAPGARTISLLTGPDNYANWTGFGFVQDKPTVGDISKRPAINLWTAAKGTDLESLAVVLQEMVIKGERRFVGPNGPAEYQLLLSKRCSWCDRRLTDPTSIRLGIGPECARKHPSS